MRCVDLLARNRLPWLVVLLAGVTLIGPSTGKAQSADAAGAAHAQYTKEGADTCMRCHDETDDYPVVSIFHTRHAQIGDPRTPFAGLQCEACHGPGAEHAKEVPPDEKQAPILNFGAKSAASHTEQDRMCLACHEDHSRVGWQGSVHEQNEVACADCHTVHVARDPALDKLVQAETCYGCHTKQRAELLRPSVHPVRFDAMACTDCHNPHDSWGPSLLIKASLNDTCYECHAEKRGPVLWEHAPVSEDCSLCHVPHGSNHNALLSNRPPFLCQQCHAQQGHPSTPWDGSGLPGGSEPFARQFLLGKSCLNCHSQVHGSNHPSGAKLTR